jgi:hypothetical protein
VSHTYLVSYGVKLDVEVQDEALRPAVEQILPPGWRPSEEFPEDGHFTLSAGDNGTYDVIVDGVAVGTELAADVAVHVLDSQLRGRIAVLARDYIFVHAGVVALGERALLLPGPSFCGKSTLVAALVAEGATYYSDEFAVLDRDGFVHPYARPLSLRTGSQRYGDYAEVAALGGRAGTHPARPAFIVLTRYVPGTRWAPARRKPGPGALALLTNAVPARPRTEPTIEAVSRAAMGSQILEGDRGEAQETAAMLIAALRVVEP